MSEVDGEQVVEEAAAKFTEKYYAEQKQAAIDYDKYHFSVAQKYDLTSRNLTWKKIKYITDEIWIDLNPRKWRTIQW